MTTVYFQLKDGTKLSTTAENYIMYNTFDTTNEKGESYVVNKEDIEKVLFCDNV